MDTIIKMCECIYNIINKHQRRLCLVWLFVVGPVGLSVAAVVMTIDVVVLLGLAWALPAAVGLAFRIPKEVVDGRNGFVFFVFFSSAVVFELLAFVMALVTHYTVWPVGIAVGIALMLVPQIPRPRLPYKLVKATSDVRESVPVE